MRVPKRCQTLENCPKWRILLTTLRIYRPRYTFYAKQVTTTEKGNSWVCTAQCACNPSANDVTNVVGVRIHPRLVHTLGIGAPLVGALVSQRLDKLRRISSSTFIAIFPTVRDDNQDEIGKSPNEFTKWPLRL